MEYYYRAFGLGIRSCLPLPELLPAESDVGAEVEIASGEVPAELPGVLQRGVRYQAAADALRLQVDRVANYLVREGKHITIARDPAADDDDVRVFLLAAAFGALLHQRGDLVLQGSAIEWDGESVVFVGPSGAGKSTLAAAFRQKGRRVLTDDLCVVRPGEDGRMMAHPGFPQMKLWLDSLNQLDIPATGLPRIRLKLEKRMMPLGGLFFPEPLPVKKLYVLRVHNLDEPKLTPVRGKNKFTTIRNQTYRFGFLTAGDKAGHFTNATRLARQAGMALALRPYDCFRLAEQVALIEADLRG